MWTEENTARTLTCKRCCGKSKDHGEVKSEETVGPADGRSATGALWGPTSSPRSAGSWSERRSCPRRFPSPPWAPRTCRPRRGRRPTSAARCPASQSPGGGVKTGGKRENSRHHVSLSFSNATPRSGPAVSGCPKDKASHTGRLYFLRSRPLNCAISCPFA